MVEPRHVFFSGSLPNDSLLNLISLKFSSGYLIQEFLDFYRDSFSVRSRVGCESHSSRRGGLTGDGAVSILDSKEGVDFRKV
jgi:hypothetical protein